MTCSPLSAKVQLSLSAGRDGSCDCVGLVYPQLAVGYSARPVATVIVVVRSRDTRRPLAHSASHGRCLKASLIIGLHIAYQLFRNTYVAPCTIPPRRWRVSETQLRLLIANRRHVWFKS